MKNKKQIVKSNAVAGVIEALLLIGLVAIIISLIQLYYVPEIMESTESDHMDQISNQYSYLKSVIEIQSAMGVISSEDSIAYTPISSPITLGSNPLPYFVTVGSTGSINVIDEDDSKEYKIDIKPFNPAPFDSGIPLTSLKYVAYNNYYLNGADLIYTLEGGGIILKQLDGESMRVFPAINIVNYSSSQPILINWNIILLKGTIGKKSFENGFGNPSEICYVRTNYTNHYDYPIMPLIDSITIYTDHAIAWYESLTQDGIGLLSEYSKNGGIVVDVNKSATPNYVKISPGKRLIDLKLTIVEIGIQVGPGTIIETT